ncbi:MAG: hypothetical protein Q9P01_11085 [Anaerolineae bacterium]|nr:hypothetical protein [Anaerolineae bacterium]MDQ7035349.1 hypothetical protein [Anaerolineae bacterium]
MRKRRSYHLSRLKSELRKRALAEEEEDKRRDTWRLFFKAQHAEHEVREMVMDAEMRRLLEFAFPNGLPDAFRDDADERKKPKSPKPDDAIDDEDIPPRQKGLWD